MNYELKFTPSAKKEWDRLDNSVRQMFKKVLAKRLVNPFVLAAELSNLPIRCFKIKLRAVGYRLIYTVENNTLVLLVLTIKPRDKVYDDLADITQIKET